MNRSTSYPVSLWPWVYLFSVYQFVLLKNEDSFNSASISDKSMARKFIIQISLTISIYIYICKIFPFMFSPFLNENFP